MINANKCCQYKYEINNTKVLYHKQHFISKPKDWNADVSFYNNNVDLSSVYPIIIFLKPFSNKIYQRTLKDDLFKEKCRFLTDNEHKGYL